MGFGSWDIWAVDAAILLAVLAGLIYTYFRQNYTYWEKQNIPFLKPKFPFGNMEDSFLMRKGIGETWVRKRQMFPNLISTKNLTGGSLQKRRGWKSPRGFFAPPSRCHDPRCWIDKNHHDQRFCSFHWSWFILWRGSWPDLSSSLFPRR